MNECATFNNNSIKTEATNYNFTGQWIWPSGKTKPGQWVSFRKEFIVGQISKSVPVKIAVDSKYWLWINGQLVIFEGQVKNGPTPNGLYYDTLDIASKLVVGKNVIAILAVYFGKDGYGCFDGGKPGLLFEADMDDSKKLVSDASWLAISNPAYHEPLEQQDKSYRLAEPDINYYAEDALDGWYKINFNDADWKFAQINDFPFDELWERPIPQFDVKAVTLFTEDGKNNSLKWTSKTSKLKKEVVIYTIQNSTNIQGTPYLKVDSPKNERIEVYTDTWKEMAGNGDSLRHSYVTKTGIQEFEAMGWINGYQIYFEIPENVKVLELGFRPSKYLIDCPAKFGSSDQFINKLVKKSYDTLLVTMRDTFMDCPDRERAQWIGDAVSEMQMAFYGMDRNAGLLYKKAMNQALQFRHISGVLPSTVPNGLEQGRILDKEGNLTQKAVEEKKTECFELPMQSLAFVQSFWQYYMYSRDKQPLQDGYLDLMTYLRLWKFDAVQGIVGHRTGTWDWDDWGENADSKIIDQCWYYEACKNMLHVINVIDDVKQEDIEFLELRMGRIKESFDGNFWSDSKQGYYNQTKNQKLDDRANALAVYTGLYNQDYSEKIVDVLVNRFESSPYMEKYVIEALYILNADSAAITRIRCRYQEMVDDNFPTLWEFWVAKEGTRNHAWTGWPLTIAYKYILGLTPLEAGYRKVRISPNIGDLESVAGSINTVFGNISVDISHRNKRFEMTIKTAVGIEMTEVVILKQFLKGGIKINGKEVYNNKVSADMPVGINFKGENSRQVIFDIDIADEKNIEIF